MFQSMWITEEAMRWSLRFCRRRFPWLQRSYRETVSIHDRLFHSQRGWSTKQSETGLCSGVVGSVRFYSQGGVHNEELEEKGHLSPVFQPEETSALTQKKSHFMENLQHCHSPSDMLDLFCHKPLPAQHISRYLTQMWAIYKTLSEEQRVHEKQLMFEHPAFEGLLDDAMKNIGYMSNQDLAYSLLGMVRLGVPQNSLVVQMFLRACQEKLNNFNEICLSLVASSLENLDDSPNVIEFKDGLRMVVDARLPKIKKVLPLQIVMRLMGRDAPLPLKRKLEEKALSMSDQFTLPNSHYMITTMAEMDFHSKPLLDICSQRIIGGLIGMPYRRLFLVLQSCRKLQYRNVELFTAISDYVTSMLDMWPTKRILFFLSTYEKLMFCPTSLMEAFAERVIEKPNALTLRNILCVLKVYAYLNYDLQHLRQPFLDGLTQVLDSYLSEMSGYELLKAAYFMALMGHFHPALLEKLLQSSTLEQLNTSVPNYVPDCARLFQMLHLSLRLDRPSLPLPLTVPPSVRGEPVSSGPPINPSLSKTLESVLKDHAEAALQESVVVEDFYVIDAVITKPQESTAAGEDRSPAESSSERIAVICSPPFSFCYGTHKPCGTLAVKIRHLKLLGYNPVLVNQYKLLSMPEEERAEFLRARIFPGHPGTDTQAKEERLGF